MIANLSCLLFQNRTRIRKSGISEDGRERDSLSPLSFFFLFDKKGDNLEQERKRREKRRRKEGEEEDQGRKRACKREDAEDGRTRGVRRGRRRLIWSGKKVGMATVEARGIKRRRER